MSTIPVGRLQEWQSPVERTVQDASLSSGSPEAQRLRAVLAC